MNAVMAVHDIAALLHVPEATIRRHIRHGDVPTVAIGGRRCVRTADVEALLKLDEPTQTLVIKPVTPAVIAQRRAIAADLDALRTQMKPLGMTTAELIRLARQEEETKYEHL